MIRVLLLLLALLSFAAAAWLGTLAPLGEEAEPVSVEQALTRLDAGAVSYVRIGAGVDRTRRVAVSPLAVPAYVSCDPGELSDLEADALADARLARLGCPVGVEARLSEQAQEVYTGGAETQCWIAPLQGSERRLWALSPTFRAGSGTWESWRRQERFEGWLGRFDDLARNRPALADRPDQIRRFYQGQWAAPVPPDALVILPDESRPWSRTDRRPTPWVAAVEGSGGRILVRLGEGVEGADTLTGVLEADPGAGARGLAEALAAPPDASVGWLHLRSGPAENLARERDARTALVTGALLLGLAVGLHGLVLAARRLRRQLRSG